MKKKINVFFLIQAHHANFIGIFGQIIELLWGSVLLFIFSEIFERVSSGFEELNDALNELDWYHLPFKLRRMLPMIMTITQQPVEFECYGSISCNRETFKDVSSVE